MAASAVTTSSTVASVVADQSGARRVSARRASHSLLEREEGVSALRAIVAFERNSNLFIFRLEEVGERCIERKALERQRREALDQPVELKAQRLALVDEVGFTTGEAEQQLDEASLRPMKAVPDARLQWAAHLIHVEA